VRDHPRQIAELRAHLGVALGGGGGRGVGLRGLVIRAGAGREGQRCEASGEKAKDSGFEHLGWLLHPLGRRGAGGPYAPAEPTEIRQQFRGVDAAIDWLSRKLDLDAAQRDKVLEIMARHRDKRRELAQKMFESCGEPLQKDKTEMDAEIRAVLRPEQIALWDQFVAAQRDHFPFGGPFGGGRGGHGPHGPGGPR
jgi:sugar phosphate isomerase/epimerase